MLYKWILQTTLLKKNEEENKNIARKKYFCSILIKVTKEKGLKFIRIFICQEVTKAIKDLSCSKVVSINGI